MLSEEMQKVVTEVTAGDVVVALQVIARAAGTGALKDYELKVIGATRENLVASLQVATGVNFDQARAAQIAEHQRKMAEAQRRQQEQRMSAAKMAANAKSEQKTPVPTPEEAPPAVDEDSEGSESREAEALTTRVDMLAKRIQPDASPVSNEPGKEGGQAS